MKDLAFVTFRVKSKRLANGEQMKQVCFSLLGKA